MLALASCEISWKLPEMPCSHTQQRVQCLFYAISRNLEDFSKAKGMLDLMGFGFGVAGVIQRNTWETPLLG